jgi:hypothetical protein
METSRVSETSFMVALCMSRVAILASLRVNVQANLNVARAQFPRVTSRRSAVLGFSTSNASGNRDPNSRDEPLDDSTETAGARSSFPESIICCTSIMRDRFRLPTANTTHHALWLQGRVLEWRAGPQAWRTQPRPGTCGRNARPGIGCGSEDCLERRLGDGVKRAWCGTSVDANRNGRVIDLFCKRSVARRIGGNTVPAIALSLRIPSRGRQEQVRILQGDPRRFSW